MKHHRLLQEFLAARCSKNFTAYPQNIKSDALYTRNHLHLGFWVATVGMLYLRLKTSLCIQKTKIHARHPLEISQLLTPFNTYDRPYWYHKLGIKTWAFLTIKWLTWKEYVGRCFRNWHLHYMINLCSIFLKGSQQNLLFSINLSSRRPKLFTLVYSFNRTDSGSKWA